MGNSGFGMTRNQIKDMIQSYVKFTNRQTPFKDGRPGPDWMNGFEDRHKDQITKKMREGLAYTRGG